MKILYIADNLRGGGKERRLVELIKGLDTNKQFELHLLLLEKKIHYDDIYTTNCNLKIIPRTRGYEIKLQIAIWKYIFDLKPDIIHYWGEIGMLYLIPIKIFSKVPLVSSIVADTSPRGGKIQEFFRQISFSQAKVILSNTMLGLKNYHVSMIKGKVIYNGFQFSRISSLSDCNELRKELNITSDHVLIMVGQYSERKDYKTFLLATEGLIKDGFNITVVTCGNGDIDKIKDYISKENKDRYRFLSFQKDVESIMNLASIGILCSNTGIHSEGISNVLLEFMALGKPVVATNDGGNVELVENGINGYLVKPHDSQDLAEKLSTLINNSSLRYNMGVNSKTIVNSKFLLKNMISQFQDVYKNAVYDH